MMFVWRLAELFRITLSTVIVLKMYTLTWTVLTGCQRLRLSHWDRSTVIRCVCMHSILSHFILHIICCIIVTWWCGPGGIEAWSGRSSSSFSAETVLIGSFDLLKLLLTGKGLAAKTVSKMTCNVLSRMLNSTLP